MANFKKLKLENKDYQNLQSSKKELCTDSKQILKGIGKNEWCGICEMNFASPASVGYEHRSLGILPARRALVLEMLEKNFDLITLVTD